MYFLLSIPFKSIFYKLSYVFFAIFLDVSVLVSYNLIGDIMTRRLDLMRQRTSFMPYPEIFKNFIEKTHQLSTKVAAELERKRFAERLKTLRNNAGLTQKQLAEKADMHPAIIARYETGNAMPRQKAILKLADALQVPPAALDVTDYRYPTLDIFDMQLLRKHGVNVKQLRPDLYRFSLPGCPEIEMDIDNCDEICERCFSKTNKAFTEVIEAYFVNLFIREAYADYEKRKATNQNDSDTTSEE